MKRSFYGSLILSHPMRNEFRIRSWMANFRIQNWLILILFICLTRTTSLIFLKKFIFFRTYMIKKYEGSV